MKKYTWNKKLISTSLISFSLFGLMTTTLAFNDINPLDDGSGEVAPEDPGTEDPGTDTPEEDSAKRKEALLMENDFYIFALEEIFKNHANTNSDWEQPYYDAYDMTNSGLGWDSTIDPTTEKAKEDITDSLLFKSVAYVDIYKATTLGGTNFNRYVLDQFTAEQDPTLITTFIEEIGGYTDDGGIGETNFLLMETLSDYEALLATHSSGTKWFDGDGFNALLDVPSVANGILSDLYSYSWLWQPEIFNGGVYDYNLTQKLANTPIALVWSLEEDTATGTPDDETDKDLEVKAGDYDYANADPAKTWDAKVEASKGTTSKREKHIDFWNDESTGFEGIKVGSTAYPMENLMDSDSTWAQVDGAREDGDDYNYTSIGMYNSKTNFENVAALTHIDDDLDAGNGSKFILNDKGSSDYYGAEKSEDGITMNISKAQTVMPVKVGIKSSWNNTGKYFTSYKYLFDFNVYSTDSTNSTDINTQYISDKKVDDNHVLVTEDKDLWEFFNFTTTDARMEMVIVNELISVDSNIFSSAKKFWFNKGFKINLEGEAEEDYGNLIDPDLLA